MRYDQENKPGVSNLLTIYCAATGKTMAEAEGEFAGQGYGVFKPAVGEAVVEIMRPIREEAERLMQDKAYLESIYQARRGAGPVPGKQDAAQGARKKSASWPSKQLPLRERT